LKTHAIPPDRRLRLCALALCYAGLFPLTALAQTAPLAHARDLDGVWKSARSEPALSPVNGGPLPFTANGRVAWNRNIELAKEGATEGCQPPGVPRVAISTAPLQIISTAGQISFVYETNHVQRWIYMDARHPADLDPTYMGHSIGRWDGDTLVVDTIGFNDLTRIDDVGAPHSDKLRVVERLRKINAGRRLEVLITIEDPEIFSKPWTTRSVYSRRPDLRLREDVCEERIGTSPVRAR
jgi:hypothetical protein